ncbi:hypothetical protein PG985_012368, partial [Apiospora marii]
NRNYD